MYLKERADISCLLYRLEWAPRYLLHSIMRNSVGELVGFERVEGRMSS